MIIHKYSITIIRFFLINFLNKNRNLIYFAVILKENKCLRRALDNHGFNRPYNPKDKKFFRFMALIDKSCCQFINFASPKTILYEWKKYIKDFWTSKTRKPGRPPLNQEIKNLILNMKILNETWGYKRIMDELGKIDISVCRRTIANVIQEGRRNGLIQSVHRLIQPFPTSSGFWRENPLR